MKIQRAHKNRLQPNNKQANYFIQACGVARFTYNWALVEWCSQYEAGKKPSVYGLKKLFNSIKLQQYPFVLQVTKCAKDNLTLMDRIYRCDSCGLEIDRDLNAAANLKSLAEGSSVAACCLGSSGSALQQSETTDWAGISHSPR